MVTAVLAFLAFVVGYFLHALMSANPVSELRDENHELKRRLAECTCREGA